MSRRMSKKKYVPIKPYCFGDIPEYAPPPMTVEEYEYYEREFFGFLKPSDPTNQFQPESGIFDRFLNFIGFSKDEHIDKHVTDTPILKNNKSARLIINYNNDTIDDSDHKITTDIVNNTVHVEEHISSIHEEKITEDQPQNPVSNDGGDAVVQTTLDKTNDIVVSTTDEKSTTTQDEGNDILEVTAEEKVNKYMKNKKKSSAFQRIRKFFGRLSCLSISKRKE